jgi:hypothetical protein
MTGPETRQAPFLSLGCSRLARGGIAIRNVGVSAVASRPFDAYAAEVRAIDPNPAPGATLTAPAPPLAVGEISLNRCCGGRIGTPGLRVKIWLTAEQ